MSKTIVITGACSGLGLAFLRHYASQEAYRILALDIKSPSEEVQVSPTFRNVEFIPVNICDESKMQQLASRFANTPINLLIHCAGVRGLVPRIVSQNPGNVEAAETYRVMDRSTFLSTFEINTFGTFNVISTFLPNLQLQRDSKAIVLSSRMGSVASNVSGGGYAYRASKAALNTVVKSFSIDVPDVAFLLLHPGRVETGLVEWKEEGAISVEESLQDCVNAIKELGKENSGKFVDRFGEEIPW